MRQSDPAQCTARMCDWVRTPASTPCTQRSDPARRTARRYDRWRTPVSDRYMQKADPAQRTARTYDRHRTPVSCPGTPRSDPAQRTARTSSSLSGRRQTWASCSLCLTCTSYPRLDTPDGIRRFRGAARNTAASAVCRRASQRRCNSPATRSGARCMGASAPALSTSDVDIGTGYSWLN